MQRRLAVLHQSLAGLLHWFGLAEPEQVRPDGTLVPGQFPVDDDRVFVAPGQVAVSEEGDDDGVADLVTPRHLLRRQQALVGERALLEHPADALGSAEC